MAANGADRGIVLVTGGNSGIGFECARALARAGCHVAIASRDRRASDAAARRIVAEGGRILAMTLDLGSFASIRQFASGLDREDVPVRALVCNAGLQFSRGPVLSADGFETTFAVNHLGHFLLANLLLRRLEKNGPARIVVVSSGVHDPARVTGLPRPDVGDWSALAATGGPTLDQFNGLLAYVNSKLCNLWFTYELIRRLEAIGFGGSGHPLSVNAFEPGLVPGSGLARDYAPVRKFLWDHLLPPLSRVVSRFVASINTAEHSGAALARVVLDPELEGTSGKYFPSHTRFREAPSSELSYDEAQARSLWDESVRLTKLSADESALA